MPIAKLTRLPLREVWKHEALDFSRWLEENIDVLAEVLDLNITVTERESAAGDFSVDLVAEDDEGHVVVIENQLTLSDHGHLGKLVTYAAALDARGAVWIVARPRPEHVQAVTWLNESMPTLFYLVQVEAVQIGDSAPAPLLTRIVGPSAEAVAVGDVKKDLSERHHLRKAFWAELLERARPRTRLHSAVSPSTSNWVAAGAGTSGLLWSYVILQHQGRVELYIDRGNEEQNLRIFDALAERRGDIERSFGEPLDWQRLEGRRGCRIAYHIAVGGWRDREQWPQVADAAIDAMIRLEAALRPQLKSLTPLQPGRSNLGGASDGGADMLGETL